jgi:hypothetical protein
MRLARSACDYADDEKLPIGLSDERIARGTWWRVAAV